MKFTYSICDPLEKEIIKTGKEYHAHEILKIASEYPWIEKLRITEQFKPEEIHYNPSLDFQLVNSKSSFAITANFNDKKELEFSLWYRRPKNIKVLFGLLGNKEKMVLDDRWGYDLETSLIHLNDFTTGNIEKLEQLFS